MDKSTLRAYVFEILKKTPQTHFHAIENDLRRVTEDYERHDVLALQEVLWELLIQGVLAPGKNSLNLNLPFVHVTEDGAQVLEDGRILVHDPDGYVERLKATVGERLDEFVVFCVAEALAVFLSGSPSSAIIQLARASEMLFDRLSAALARSESQEAAARFTRTQAQQVLRSAQQQALPKELSEALDTQLGGLLTLVQCARNADESPRQLQPSRDQVLGYLLLFPEQCAFAYDLLEALRA